MEELLKDIRRKIRPKEEEEREVEKRTKQVEKKLKKAIGELDEDAEVFLGGSIAKGTWLRGDHDFDFFIRFKSGKNYSKRLKTICRKAFEDFKEIPGSRNYYKVWAEDTEIELVPVKYIENPKEAENPMDVSPLHVSYVRDYMEGKEDEVRLFKKFLRACGCYGAETWISGFSGYCSELLVLGYSSFQALLKGVKEKQPKVYMDVGDHYKSKEEALENLKEAKIKSSPLILIDPVEPNRNAAAALNYQKYAEFVFQARIFLRNPSRDFFKEEETKFKEVKLRSRKRGTPLRSFEVNKKEDEKEKVFLAKLKRELRRAQSRFKKEGYSVFDKGFVKEKGSYIIYFEFETKKLSKKKKHFGPPPWVPEEHFNAFYRKWEGQVRVEDARLFTELKRKSLDEIFEEEKAKISERIR